MAPRSFALGLGGNLGDVRSAMRTSVEKLLSDGRISELKVSSIYETPPWGDVQGGDFLNASVSGLWCGDDLELLDLCHHLEGCFSTPVKKNGAARELDIDILFIEGGVSSVELTLPHPRMTLRRFVLVPLAEVWSEIVPGLSYTPAMLLKHVPDCSSIIFRGEFYSS